ncbi:MAG TPA: hypothetical protein VGE04_12160 [Chloroflexia bacterium]|jgi:hypothetical protein
MATSRLVPVDGEDGASPARLSPLDKAEWPGAAVEGDEEAGRRATPTLKQRGMKKYQIVVPESLFEEIEKIADSRQTTVIDIIRRFLKLGILTAKIENTPNAGLFIREGESEREIILL